MTRTDILGKLMELVEKAELSAEAMKAGCAFMLTHMTELTGKHRKIQLSSNTTACATVIDRALSTTQNTDAR